MDSLSGRNPSTYCISITTELYFEALRKSLADAPTGRLLSVLIGGNVVFTFLISPFEQADILTMKIILKTACRK
jgi:hypothetical protein